jgi:hypothetical protein
MGLDWTAGLDLAAPAFSVGLGRHIFPRTALSQRGDGISPGERKHWARGSGRPGVFDCPVRAASGAMPSSPGLVHFPGSRPWSPRRFDCLRAGAASGGFEKVRLDLSKAYFWGPSCAVVRPFCMASTCGGGHVKNDAHCDIAVPAPDIGGGGQNCFDAQRISVSAAEF